MSLGSRRFFLVAAEDLTVRWPLLRIVDDKLAVDPTQHPEATVRVVLRLAHDLGLGVGDPRAIEIVGDQSAAAENWHFAGPFQHMTFASRMQHQIYWGPLKKPVEWSLKTVLAPWAYIASVLYHDSFWYPILAKRKMHDVMGSPWGRLFRHWEHAVPDARGYPVIPDDGAETTRTGMRALGTSVGILATCIKEAPEFGRKRRHQAAEADARP